MLAPADTSQRRPDTRRRHGAGGWIHGTVHTARARRNVQCGRYANARYSSGRTGRDCEAQPVESNRRICGRTCCVGGQDRSGDRAGGDESGGDDFRYSLRASDVSFSPRPRRSRARRSRLRVPIRRKAPATPPMTSLASIEHNGGSPSRSAQIPIRQIRCWQSNSTISRARLLREAFPWMWHWRCLPLACRRRSPRRQPSAIWSGKSLRRTSGRYMSNDLTAMGVGADTVRAFVTNRWLPPTLSVPFVDNLAQISAAKNRAAVVALASTVASEGEARFMVNAVSMARQVGTERDPVVGLDLTGRIMVVRTRGGRFVVPAPVDFVVWTEAVKAFAEHSNIKAHAWSARGSRHRSGIDARARRIAGNRMDGSGAQQAVTGLQLVSLCG